MLRMTLPLLLAVIALTGCSASAEESKPAENDPAKNATEGNTPRAGSTGSIEVDDLRWHITGAYSTARLGEEGAGQVVASGVFVVVYLGVTDNKSESITTTGEVVHLTANGKSYAPDVEAGLQLSGKDLIDLEVGPGVTAEAGVVFDVAPQVLREHPSLQFSELGFGSTHGYIALPSKL